jgi:hypothetical protein
VKHKSLLASMVVLGVALAISVWGDSTSLSISNGSATVTSGSSTILNFPITRAGDTSYDAFLQYQTLDGTALAGTDYTAAMGSIVIPAGITSATIPVTVAGSSSNPPDKTFQMQLLGGGGAGMGFAPSFAARQAFGTGGESVFVTTADINGDGKPDLIVPSSIEERVSVLLNTTAPGAVAPSFATRQAFATGIGPSSVTAADLNGDGKPDVIVVNHDDNTVSVLLNTTSPGATAASFATQQAFATGSQPISVTAADVNGDGKPDLIVTNIADNTVSVLLNTTAPGATTPSFAPQQTFATGINPHMVITADVNGDGKPDIITADVGGNTVSVLLNTTAPGAITPSFAAKQTFAVGIGPFSVTAADVNGDGKPDLVVANAGDNTVSVLLSTTAPGAITPSFAAEQTFATGTTPVSVAAADVNPDGKPDLVVANQGGNNISVLLNTTAPGATTPSFSTQQTFAAGFNLVSVTAADVNSDGGPDLIAVNRGNGTVSVLLNTAPAPTTTFDGNSFATHQDFATGSAPFSVAAADVNGDGLSDLIVLNSGGNTVSVLLDTTAPGASTPIFATQQTFATGSNPHSVAVADINGDGLPDIVVANFLDNTVSVLLNMTAPGATTPNLAIQQTFSAGNRPISVTSADVNGDGRPDLIVANELASTVSVLLNATAPGATTPSFAAPQAFAAGNLPFSVTAADVNGDGKPDLIVANLNDNTVSVLLNTTAPGASTPTFATQQAFATGFRPQSVAVADVNGDGKPDLIVANSGDNTVSVLLNTTAPGATTPSFATQQTFATVSQPDSVTTADVNGDGKPDLIVANFGGNTVSVLLNTTVPGAATPSFATQQTFATRDGGRSVTAADVNSDGKPDLILANFHDGTVSVLLNTLYATTASGSPATGTIHYSVPTPTSTATATASATATATATSTATATATNTATATATDTATATATATATNTATTTATNTATATATDTATATATDTATATATNTATATATNTATATATNTATATATATDTATATATNTVTATATATATATTTQTATATPTATPTTTIMVPTSLAMGNSPVRDSVTKNLTVKNTGTHPLFVGAAGTVTSNDVEFGATGNTTCPGGGLAPTMTCTIQIEFTPALLGQRSATLSVHDNASSSPQHVAVSGTGVADMTVTPTSFMLSSTKIGSKATKSITVSNRQTNSVSLSEGFSGTNHGDFSVTGGTCMSTLAAKASCTLIVTYAPSALGTESATMTVTDSPDTLGPYAVSFTTAENIPATVAPAATLAFGTTTVAHPNRTKSITVTNLSAFALAVSEGSIGGANAGDFAVTGGTCGASVAANSSCTIAITFTPTLHATVESGSIAVTIGSDPTSPHNVALTGTGP